jgi:hypothetical protein
MDRKYNNQKKKEQKDRSCKSMDRQYNDKKKKEQKDRSRNSMDRQYHGQKKKEQKERSGKSMDRQYVCPLIYGFCPFVLFSFGYCIVCPLIYGFCPFVLKNKRTEAVIQWTIPWPKEKRTKGQKP